MMCSVEGCHRPKVKRGWCGTHYQRWRLTGDLSDRPPGPRPRSPQERIIARVEYCGDCWLVPSNHSAGYRTVVVGSTLDGSRQPQFAHRVMYEIFVAPIPEGHDVHHECHQRNCVNPKHLKAITHADHARLHGKGASLTYG